jgi:hypothetical protein
VQEAFTAVAAEAHQYPPPHLALGAVSPLTVQAWPARQGVHSNVRLPTTMLPPLLSEFINVPAGQGRGDPVAAGQSVKRGRERGE